MNLATGLLALFGALLVSATAGVAVGQLLRRADNGDEPADAARRRRALDALAELYEHNERGQQ